VAAAAVLAILAAVEGAVLRKPAAAGPAL